MEKLVDRVFVLGVVGLAVLGVAQHSKQPESSAGVKMEEVEKKAQEVSDKKFNDVAQQLNGILKQFGERLDKVDPPKKAAEKK